jgi:hypothetical protein
MKPEIINLRFTFTRSTTKKIKRWVELDSELLALSSKQQNLKKQIVQLKKIKPRKIKRNESKYEQLQFKYNL